MPRTPSFRLFASSFPFLLSLASLVDDAPIPPACRHVLLSDAYTKSLLAYAPRLMPYHTRHRSNTNNTSPPPPLSLKIKKDALQPKVCTFPPADLKMHPEDESSKVFLAVGRALASVNNCAMTVKDLAESALRHGLTCTGSAPYVALVLYLNAQPLNINNCQQTQRRKPADHLLYSIAPAQVCRRGDQTAHQILCTHWHIRG